MYCEKPIGWSVRAAQAVRKAVQESKVVFQFGTQQRSTGKFRQACELVRNGKIGQLKTILVGVPGSWTCPKQPVEPVPKELDYDMWLGPAPTAPYCYQRCRPWTQGQGWGGYSIWYCISDYCLGMIGNWGVHHLDIAQWGNGTDLGGPTEIEGTGVFPKDMLTDCATNWQVENRYANGVTLVHMDDATAQKHPLQQNGHGHGVMFLGSEGWVHVDRSKLDAKDAVAARSGSPAPTMSGYSRATTTTPTSSTPSRAARSRPRRSTSPCARIPFATSSKSPSSCGGSCGGIRPENSSSMTTKRTACSTGRCADRGDCERRSTCSTSRLRPTKG